MLISGIVVRGERLELRGARVHEFVDRPDAARPAPGPDLFLVGRAEQPDELAVGKECYDEFKS